MIIGYLPLWFVLPCLFVIGTFLGSFLNVCIYRIPRHERLRDQLRNLVYPPSSCPSCGERISRLDNIPIFGWLKLCGRCRYCRRRISPRYPLVELLNGLLFVALYLCEIPVERGSSIAGSSLFAAQGPQTIAGLSDVAWLHWRYLYHLVLVEALLVATFIDFDRMIIPDAVTVPAMLVGVVGSAAFGQLFIVSFWFQDPHQLRLLPVLFGYASIEQAPGWMQALFSGPARPSWITEFPHLHGLAVSLVGLLVGGGVVWAVRIIGRWALRKEAMGFGDVTLMAAIGSFLGWQPVLVIFFLAPVCALAVLAASWLLRQLARLLRVFSPQSRLVAALAQTSRRTDEIPYGPYLSLATLIALARFDRIWPYAERFFEWGPLLPLFALVTGLALAVSLQGVAFVRRLLGLTPQTSGWMEQWTAADQLAYFAGETVDDQQGRWRDGHRWPGTDAARGRAFEERWRSGAPPSSIPRCSPRTPRR